MYEPNNKVVLLGAPLSSCSRLVHSVVYVITPLPGSYFIVVLTFISLHEYTVSALSHFTGYETGKKKKRKRIFLVLMNVVGLNIFIMFL